jgi:DNA polymerase III epsilon subunit-like protein
MSASVSASASASEVTIQPKKKLKIAAKKERIFLFFDLETNGKRPFYQSAIMQLAIYDSREDLPNDGGCNRSAIKNIYVRPYDDFVGATEIHGISEETLAKGNAITSRQMIDYLVTTYPKSGIREYVFVAFNNFGFDQNVLEHHFHHHGLQVPENWIFADIFPYISQYYPKLRSDGGYKLSNCYEKICCSGGAGEGAGVDINFHNATDDVYCLAQLYYKVSPDPKKMKNTFMRGSYTRGTILESPISSIAGYANFFKIEEKGGITSIGEMYAKFVELGATGDAFRKFLHEKIGIYSAFYQTKIVEQFEILHHLLHKSL